MSSSRTAVQGRQWELATLDNALDEALGAADRHVLTVVRGSAGVGKTTLLTAATQRWRERRIRVLSVSFDDLPEWDQLGATAMVAVVRQQFEELGDARLADSIDVLRRMCGPDAYQSPQRRSALVVELTKMFARVASRGPFVVVADRLDLVANPSFALVPACRPGCLVVAAYTGDGFTNAHFELDYVADHLVHLDALPDDAIAPLLAAKVGATLDDATLDAIRSALGPLAHHPGTLLSTVDYLREAGRLVVHHGRACLVDEAAIMLPADHPVIGHIGGRGSNGRHLMALAATCVRFGVDDLPALAATTGRNLAEYGPEVDRLVRLGVLECGLDGGLTCTCPALTARLLEQADGKVALLHRAIADYLLTRDRDAVDQVVLADHIALAGRQLEADRRHADLLVDQADRLVDLDEERAALWYGAALCHLGPESEQRKPVVAALTRVLLRIGRLDWLIEVVEREARSGDVSLDAETAAAAAVAALHLSRPIPSAVAVVLPEVAEFEECWYAGEPVDDALLSWIDPLRVKGIRSAEGAFAFDDAVADQDLAALFHTELGVHPRVQGSALSKYHSVIRDYRSGDWAAALSSIRQLDIAAPTGAIASMIRLLAAEICAEQGDSRQASGWLEAAGTDCRFAAMHAWVESGMRWRSGEAAEAFDAGWQACQRVCADHDAPAVDQLLARLAVIAVECGRADQAAAVLDEIEDRRSRGRTRFGRQTLLLVRGIVDGDLGALRAGADVARRCGDIPSLLVACMAAADLTDEPRPWLHEAYEIASGMGASMTRARAWECMRARGVSVPRAQTQPAALSDTGRRIAELIRDGRTNRQIAVELRISEKTVEYHLSRLFARTGSRTRVELASATVRGALDQLSA